MGTVVIENLGTFVGSPRDDGQINEITQQIFQQIHSFNKYFLNTCLWDPANHQDVLESKARCGPPSEACSAEVGRQ